MYSHGVLLLHTMDTQLITNVNFFHTIGRSSISNDKHFIFGNYEQQDLFVKHYIPCRNKVKKYIFQHKCRIKGQKVLVDVECACQI